MISPLSDPTWGFWDHKCLALGGSGTTCVVALGGPGPLCVFSCFWPQYFFPWGQSFYFSSRLGKLKPTLAFAIMFLAAAKKKHNQLPGKLLINYLRHSFLAAKEQ